MQDKDLWATFCKTGCVSDYLNYKGISNHEENVNMGEKIVEGNGNSDRNDLIGETGWRL